MSRTPMVSERVPVLRIPPLLLFEDAGGSAVIGLVAPEVIFACVVNDASHDLVSRVSTVFESFAAEAGRVSLFLDLRSSDWADPVTGKIVLKTGLRTRRNLDSMTALVQSSHAPAVKRIAHSLLGSAAFVTASPDEFDNLLIDAAPLAHQQMHHSLCVRQSG